MRLILVNRFANIPDKTDVPDNTVLFRCFEDFTFGPIHNWKDPERFQTDREALWYKEQLRDWPEEAEPFYTDWIKILPYDDTEDRILQGLIKVSDDFEFEERLVFQELAPQADVIEIWADNTVSDSVWRWYLIAVLDRMEINTDRIKLCLFDGDLRRMRRAFGPGCSTILRTGVFKQKSSLTSTEFRYELIGTL